MNQPTKKTYYNKDGSIYSKCWYLNDKLHKVDGPAEVYHRKDGSVDYEDYWLNDECLSREDFLVSKEYQNYLADQEIERILYK